MEHLTEEQRAFLSRGTYTGKLATAREDGRAHVVPIWFVLDNDTIVFETGAQSVKAKNMRRVGRASLCVDDEQRPYAYLTVEGPVSLEEDPRDLLDWSTRIAARYVGDKDAAKYGKLNAQPGSVIARITPEKILFESRITDFE